DVPALDLGLDELVAHPAQAVAGDLVAALYKRRERLRIPSERHGHAENCQRQVAAAEDSQHAPHPGTRPVFVERLHTHVSVRKRLCANDFGEKRLRRLIPVQHTVLGALFVVEDELDGDVRPAWPLRVGWVGPVTDHVARIVGGSGHARTLAKIVSANRSMGSRKRSASPGGRSRPIHGADITCVMPTSSARLYRSGVGGSSSPRRMSNGSVSRPYSRRRSLSFSA